MKPKGIRPEWAEDVTRRMYRHGIRRRALSDETGYGAGYISSILSGRLYSERAQVAIMAAVDRLIDKLPD